MLKLETQEKVRKRLERLTAHKHRPAQESGKLKKPHFASGDLICNF